MEGVARATVIFKPLANAAGILVGVPPSPIRFLLGSVVVSATDERMAAGSALIAPPAPKEPRRKTNHRGTDPPMVAAGGLEVQ